MFVDRETELADLDHFYRTGVAELIVVTGRRRVGKTALLRKYCSDKQHLYFISSQVNATSQFEAFSTEWKRVFPHSVVFGTISSWEVMLDAITQSIRQERFILVLDEFQYLCEASPELPSVLQKWWDTNGKQTKIMLVLCGSQISFMEQKLLGARAPLFGRRTGQMKITQLPVWAVTAFFPNWSLKDRLTAYAVLGGVPAYLERFQPNRRLSENLADEVLSPRGLLFDEVNFLLRSELSTVGTYLSILKAIAGGATRVSEIANRINITTANVPVYLQTLRDLHLVIRETPFTEPNPESSKKGIYRIADRYIEFWCRFLLPNRSSITQDTAQDAWQNYIAPYWDAYLGGVFEKICHEYMPSRWAKRTGTQPLRIGKLWSRDSDLDLLAEIANGKRQRVLIAECKAWQSQVGVNVYHELQRNVEHYPKLQDYEWQYALFALNGFTPAMRQLAQDENVELITGSEIFAIEE